MTNRDQEYNAFTPKTLGAIASSLSMLRPPDVRQSFPVKAHQDAASADPRPGWRNLRILAIPGSLRTASSNAILLDSAAALTPVNVEVIVYRGLAALPHFNPDLDNDLVYLPVPSFVPSYAYPMESCS